MASFAGISATARSLERVLNHAFSQEEPVPGKKTRAVMVRTDDLDPSATNPVILTPGLSIYCYRADFNKTMRAAWSAIASQDGRSRLVVDLHILLTAWAENADFELRILGKAMQCLEDTPILTGPMLDPLADWAPHESIQVVLEELTTEAVMRIFDSLPADYRLSVPYIARVLRIDGRVARPDRPVTTLVVGEAPSSRP